MNTKQMCTVIMMMGASVPAMAQVPSTVTYRGSLSDADGRAVQGRFPTTFAIYDTPGGGVPLWSESHDVQVEDGRFSVALGSQNTLTPELFSAHERWLDVSIDGEILSPRLALSSAPSALVCEDAVGDIHPASISIQGVGPVIDGAGRWVGIGTTNPSHLLHVNGVARSSSSTWATSSDQRIKPNVTEIEGALDRVRRFRPVTYAWTEDYRADHDGLPNRNFGFIAQEAERIVPEMVRQVKETVGGQVIPDFRVMDHSPLVPLLVGAVQEQQATIDDQAHRLQALEARLADLETKLSQQLKRP